MRRTSRLLVLFGIGLAVLTFVLIVALLPGGGGGGGIGPKATPTAPANVSVVVAAQDIALGAQVTADMVTTQTLPANQAATDGFNNVSLVIGQIARRPILTGAQVRKADFALDQTGQTVTVPTGKRAMSLYVSDLTGVGRLLHVGDTVDVVVTFDENILKVLSLPQGATTPAHDDGFKPLTTKVILQDIQVIGTLQAPSAPTAASNQAAASPQPTGATADAAAQKLIILAVTDDQAEALLFARYGGTVDLILRSPVDEGVTTATKGVILRTMFEKYGVLPPYLLKQFPLYLSQQPQ